MGMVLYTIHPNFFDMHERIVQLEREGYHGNLC